MVVEEVRAYRGLDTMALTGLIVDAITTWHPDQVVVDEVGIGTGVVDRLRELGHHVHSVNVGRSAQERQHWGNLRAEGYWSLRQMFVDGSIKIPEDNEMVGQMAGLRYRFNSNGQVLVESKEEMRRRGIPSPDKADALMLSFLPNKRKVKLWS